MTNACVQFSSVWTNEANGFCDTTQKRNPQNGRIGGWIGSITSRQPTGKCSQYASMWCGVNNRWHCVWCVCARCPLSAIRISHSKEYLHYMLSSTLSCIETGMQNSKSESICLKINKIFKCKSGECVWWRDGVRVEWNGLREAREKNVGKGKFDLPSVAQIVELPMCAAIQSELEEIESLPWKQIRGFRKAVADCMLTNEWSLVNCEIYWPFRKFKITFAVSLNLICIMIYDASIFSMTNIRNKTRCSLSMRKTQAFPLKFPPNYY